MADLKKPRNSGCITGACLMAFLTLGVFGIVSTCANLEAADHLRSLDRDVAILELCKAPKFLKIDEHGNRVYSCTPKGTITLRHSVGEVLRHKEKHP